MKVVAEIEIPDGWFRAPNGNNDDTIWWHRPEAPDRPYEVENVRTVKPLIWQILAQVVPAACPSHPTTPGYFPCGNVCAVGHTDCPVQPLDFQPVRTPEGPDGLKYAKDGDTFRRDNGDEPW